MLFVSYCLGEGFGNLVDGVQVNGIINPNLLVSVEATMMFWRFGSSLICGCNLINWSGM